MILKQNTNANAMRIQFEGIELSLSRALSCIPGRLGRSRLIGAEIEWLLLSRHYAICEVVGTKFDTGLLSGSGELFNGAPSIPILGSCPDPPAMDRETKPDLSGFSARNNIPGLQTSVCAASGT